MAFTYTRTIRFQDTDAAGVVYFANVLVICHETYEESLIASGIYLKSFFQNSNFAIPIVHTSVDFFRPMFCGDKVIISLSPVQINANKFEIYYQFYSPKDEVLSKAITKHICIEPNQRTRKELPEEIIAWLHQWGDVVASS